MPIPALRDDPGIIVLPYRGAPTTISVIRAAAMKSQTYPVRRFVERICSGLASKDYTSECLAIYNHICSKTRYMRDPRTIELVKAPYVVAEQIEDGETPNLDCDDLTAVISCCLAIAGCPSSAVTVAFKHMSYRGQRQYSHVFARAEPRPGHKIVLDPVAGPRTQAMLRRVVAAKVWPIA